jgi:multiple sugar transport system ATP-binding protein
LEFPLAQIVLDQVDKVYQSGVKALDDLNLGVGEGEFMVLTGLSGCGKSTALRSIAGLEEITGGTISIGDRVVNDLPPKDRDIVTVGQNYTLYPRMTVAENLAFGLKLRNTPRAEIKRRVSEAARMLSLEPYLSHHPATLSAGQRQRVAMGRAIVREPQAFLMDEPLSRLDAGLRVSMRAALGRLHQRLGITTVYVTHDQIEAMTLGDRVCVMRDGRIQQADTPQRVLDSPANLFVAHFIGSPGMNFAEAVLDRDHGPCITFAGRRVPLPAALLDSRPGLARYFGRKVILGVRPTDFADAAWPDPAVTDTAVTDAARTDTARTRFPVTVSMTVHLGTEIDVIFPIDAPPVEHASVAGGPGQNLDIDRNARTDGTAAGAGRGKSRWTARVSSRSLACPWRPLELTVDTSALHFFDPGSGETIGNRQPAPRAVSR